MDDCGRSCGGRASMAADGVTRLVHALSGSRASVAAGRCVSVQPFTNSACPFDDATRIGVSPSLFGVFTSAPEGAVRHAVFVRSVHVCAESSERLHGISVTSRRRCVDRRPAELLLLTNVGPKGSKHSYHLDMAGASSYRTRRPTLIVDRIDLRVEVNQSRQNLDRAVTCSVEKRSLPVAPRSVHLRSGGLLPRALGPGRTCP
jgi:hypothetical protein